jgi:hypothetical protein
MAFGNELFSRLRQCSYNTIDLRRPGIRGYHYSHGGMLRGVREGSMANS